MRERTPFLKILGKDNPIVRIIDFLMLTGSIRINSIKELIPFWKPTQQGKRID
jgi:hypothetical protein